MGIKIIEQFYTLSLDSVVPRPKFVTAADGLHHRYARTRVWESDCKKSVTNGMLIVCTRGRRLDRNYSIHILMF